MQKICTHFTTFFIILIAFSMQSIAGQNTSFKFPSTISYKILRNKQYSVGTVLTFGKKGSTYLLTMGNIQGFGISSTEEIIAYMNPKDLSLYSTFVKKGTNIQEELRFKEEKNLGLLGNQVYIHKSFGDSSPTITEIGSPFTVIDLLSSFVVLSNKIYKKNYGNEQYNLFIKTSYIVECSVKKNVFRQYKNEKVCTSQVTLKYSLSKEQKKTQPESVDLFVFYIYNDKSKGICFPICVELEDATGNKFQMIAAEAIP